MPDWQLTDSHGPEYLGVVWHAISSRDSAYRQRAGVGEVAVELNREDGTAYDTIGGHIAAGRVTAKKTVSVDDLLFAATWCEAFECSPADDPEALQALATVAASLRRQAARREATGRLPNAG